MARNGACFYKMLSSALFYTEMYNYVSSIAEILLTTYIVTYIIHTYNFPSQHTLDIANMTSIVRLGWVIEVSRERISEAGGARPQAEF